MKALLLVAALGVPAFGEAPTPVLGYPPTLPSPSRGEGTVIGNNYGTVVIIQQNVVVVGAGRELTAAQRAARLADIEARRRSYLQRADRTTVSDFQFRLQEAVDRQALGLPFAAQPF